jgi:DNA-binding NtrC family response regulator
MATAKILFADNDQYFLETRREFLEREGYTVIPAFSPTEARKKLIENNPDLAILDIRLVNDDDEKDNSGVELAKEISRSVPVLLLTNWPSVEYARQVLRPQLNGSPAAYDFIPKQEGPETMLTAVRHALEAVEAQKTALSPAVPEVTWWEQWRPVVGMITLLLAFGAGVAAMVFGDPRWLLGTVTLAILFVVLVGLTIEPSE